MGKITYPMEMDAKAAAEALGKGAVLLDVREPVELDFCKVQGSLDIPMGQVPHQLERIPGNGCLLVMCHHGMRSGQVTAFLRSRGFGNAVNVAGGIDAWSQSVDPRLGRY